VADRNGFPFAVLWCDAPDEILVERLRSRSEDRTRSPMGGRAPGRAPRPLRVAAHKPGVFRLDTTAEAESAIEKALSEIGAQIAVFIMTMNTTF
jgi:hypothetical protein